MRPPEEPSSPLPTMGDSPAALRWRELALVACDARLSPARRRDAEKALRTRLPGLSIGERVALARHPSRGIVEMLREDVEAAVLVALCGNPRATRADVARILARPDAPPPFLSWLATSPWAGCREILHGLVRHDGLARASALSMVRALSREELTRLSHDVMAPRLVRVAAERRLLAGPAGDPDGQEGVG